MKERKPSARTRFGLLHALLADEALSASAKVVATTLLLKFQNTKSGRCNPSVAAIAAAVGRSRRAVFPSIEELKAAQWLTIKGTRGGGCGSTNQFTFAHPDKKVKPTAPPTGEADSTPTGEADFTYEVYSTKGAVHRTRTIENHSLLRRESVWAPPMSARLTARSKRSSSSFATHGGSPME